MLTNECESENKLIVSEDEMDLDLPVAVNLKRKMAMRVLESSENGSGSESVLDDQSSLRGTTSNLQSSLVDSELEEASQGQSYKNSQSNPKKKKTQGKFLSNEFIIDSDIDGMDAPDQLSEGLSGDDDSENGGAVRRKSLSSKKTAKRGKKAANNDFVKASGKDFKTTLKFIGNDSSEESDDRSDFDSFSESDEADDEGGEEEVVKRERVKKENSSFKEKTQQQQKQQPSSKKPKETLKSILKESEALLRRQEPVSLPIDVINPRSLSLVLNEALATNSKTPKDAIKLVIEEKRRTQRLKLERILGKERMVDLIKSNPRIGQNKLDETVEINETVYDEKAPLNEESGGVENIKIKFKLIDLPDKHFDPNQKNKRGAAPEVVAGYRAHLQIQKKSSIDILNAQLKDRIAAQGDALLAQRQHARAVHQAAIRAKAEASEQKRRMKEVRRERELKAKREAKIDGNDLFGQSKKKYEGIERRNHADESDKDDTRSSEYDSDDEEAEAEADDDYEVGARPQTKAKVLISSEAEYDEASSSASDADLLNLDNGSDCDGDGDNAAHLPDMNDAMSALLSGKFASESESSESGAEAAELGPVNNATRPSVKQPLQAKSAFIDDEASDEDDEGLDGDDYGDEEAMEIDMRRSKFIADDEGGDEEGSGADPYATIKLINEITRRNDEAMTKKYTDKLSKHVIPEGDKLLDSLSKRYGVLPSEQAGDRAAAHGDKDIQRLLDPIEQKKRKLAALGGGSWNILQRQGGQGQLIAADDEFRFKDEKKKTPPADGNDDNSDYYASETDHESSGDNEAEAGDGDDDEKYYEAVESGLQSRVEEMLDAEMLDCEEIQVQASESLVAHLAALTAPARPTTADSQLSRRSGAGVTVPLVNAKLRSRLMALQQENDDEGGNSGNGDKKGGFKGFTFKN